MSGFVRIGSKIFNRSYIVKANVESQSNSHFVNIYLLDKPGNLSGGLWFFAADEMTTTYTCEFDKKEDAYNLLANIEGK